jgi:hypothetical protein
MLLAEYNRKVVQGRMRGPEFAGEGVFLGRDREQKQMIDRNHGPDQHGHADQQQPRLDADLAQGWKLHRANLFIARAVSS